VLWLALRMSLYNRLRLAVTLGGVVISSFLTIVEVGLYIGMMGNATSLIRHASGADIWIASKGIRNVDFAKLFNDASVKRVATLPEVLWAKPIMLSWGFLKLRDGAEEQVEIIGYDPDQPVGGPWLMAQGSVQSSVNPLHHTG